MKAGYTIDERQVSWFGDNRFSWIYVFNWQNYNQVDMMGWGENNPPYLPEKYTVAVFKIKWK